MESSRSSRIRVLFGFNSNRPAGDMADLRDQARAIRNEPGCLDFDYYRGVHFPENFARAEIWESAAAYDRYWLKSGAAALACDVRELCAPFHAGSADYPRREGVNTAEFYRHETFEKTNKRFHAKDALRSETIRWPTWSGVRIITNLCYDESLDEKLVDYSLDTRKQPGCLEFDWLRSIEFPENMLHLELWSAPPSLYDAHYFQRTICDIWGTGVARPFPQQRERRYGTSGFEFYQHCHYALCGQVWEPENPALRLQSIQWS